MKIISYKFKTNTGSKFVSLFFYITLCNKIIDNELIFTSIWQDSFLLIISSSEDFLISV